MGTINVCRCYHKMVTVANMIQNLEYVKYYVVHIVKCVDMYSKLYN